MHLGYETETIEFKKSTSELKEGIISIASMLNKHQEATLYFGVKNDGTPIGQQIGESTMRDISQGIAHAIKPTITPTLAVEFHEGIQILKVSVQGNDTPYSAYGRYYIRTADSDREMPRTYLENLILHDSNSIMHVPSDQFNLTFSQLKMLYANKRLTLNEDTFLSNLNLLTKEGEYNLLANLLADENFYSMKVAIFHGTDKLDLKVRNEYGFNQ